jgi:hypothetical protein
VAKVKIINKAVEAGKVAPEVVEKLRTGEVSINRVVKDVKEAATAERRTEQRKEAVAKAEPQFFDNVHVGDFRDHFDKVADGSLSLIFTTRHTTKRRRSYSVDWLSLQRLSWPKADR